MKNGVINIYKERGYTSHDVVAKLRGILRQKKIGHTGTLDPEAEGVLPVCLGKGTKLCDMLTDHDKVYEAVLLLGMSTDTQDTTGQVTARGEAPEDESLVREAVMSFVGSYDQVPPMYSALKVNGQKLCDLARAGKEVERKSRPVTIYEIRIEEICLPRVRMTVSCSKGTYIRTLCHDIGEKLGCHGCMESLKRTRVGQFEIKDSLTLHQVEELRDQERLHEAILPVDGVFLAYPAVILREEYARYGYNGNSFLPEDLVSPLREPTVRVYDEAGTFIGIYGYGGETDCYRPVKMFYEKQIHSPGENPMDL